MKKLLTILICICLLTGCAGRSKEAEAVSEKIDDEILVPDFDIYAEMGIGSYSILKIMDEDATGTYHIGISEPELTSVINQGKGEVFFINYDLAKAFGDQLEIVSINAMNNVYMVHNGLEFESARQFSDKKIYMLDREVDRRLLETAAEHYGINDELKIEYLGSYEEIYKKVMESEDSVGIIQQPYVSLLQHRNENVHIVMDLYDIWKEEKRQSNIITDCIAVRKEVADRRKEEVGQYLDLLYGYSNFMYKNPEEYMKLVKRYVPDDYIEEIGSELSSFGFAFIKGRILDEAIALFEKEL